MVSLPSSETPQTPLLPPPPPSVDLLVQVDLLMFVKDVSPPLLQLLQLSSSDFHI